MRRESASAAFDLAVAALDAGIFGTFSSSGRPCPVDARFGDDAAAGRVVTTPLTFAANRAALGRLPRPKPRR
jgi:hypothetical protein